jgi:hypothetical protein
LKKKCADSSSSSTVKSSLPPYQCPQNLPFPKNDPLTENQRFWRESSIRKHQDQVGVQVKFEEPQLDLDPPNQVDQPNRPAHQLDPPNHQLHVVQVHVDPLTQANLAWKNDSGI